MKTAVSFILLVAGLVSIVMGIHGYGSFSLDLSQFFTKPSKAVWMLFGGFAATFIGLCIRCAKSKTSTA
jgi:hypothetical protein